MFARKTGLRNKPLRFLGFQPFSGNFQDHRVQAAGCSCGKCCASSGRLAGHSEAHLYFERSDEVVPALAARMISDSD